MIRINSISSSLGQKRNEANITIVREIVEAEKHKEIKELIDNRNNTEYRQNRYV